MATADFWTSALPVIGTIGGGVLVSITSAVTTGRRDRLERGEKYRIDQRTSVVNAVSAANEWISAIELLYYQMGLKFAGIESNFDKLFDGFPLVHKSLNMALTEARILVGTSLVVTYLDRFDDKATAYHRELMKTPVRYAIFSSGSAENSDQRVQDFADELARREKLIESMRVLTAKIEMSAVSYFSPRMKRPTWWRSLQFYLVRRRALKRLESVNNAREPGPSSGDK